ncbi:hypothetical protein ABZZ79_38660 [Streptomyces sp. NPDC006458]|uniref:hypothetical protein n=1 Tax=Streptomyces sp. NPDC006458 TaxID=3154302 RepID=UPI0033B56975
MSSATPTPTPTPSPSTPSPSAPPTGGTGTSTTWFTSPQAVAAAQRMAAAGAVGDPACSMAAVGRPDPSLVPQVGRIGIGNSGAYWCLIW